MQGLRGLVAGKGVRRPRSGSTPRKKDDQWSPLYPASTAISEQGGDDFGGSAAGLRAGLPALNNILASKATAAIFIDVSNKFFGKPARNESPPTTADAGHDLSRAPDYLLIGFETAPSIQITRGTPEGHKALAIEETVSLDYYRSYP
ncbi:unnamed protein product, partial [Iphiclides podalirius]